MCTYFIGEVHKHTGSFQDAVESFEAVLNDRPQELGILMSLAQTYLDQALLESSTGFISRAEESCLNAVRTAQRAIEYGAGFRHLQLKIIGDALFHLSSKATFDDDDRLSHALESVGSLLESRISDRLSGIVTAIPHVREGGVCDLDILEIALVVYDHRLDLGLHDDASVASAWTDHAVASHRLGTKVHLAERKERALKRAVSSMTEALKADPGNDTHWSLLGSMSFADRPKSAQAAYIRALEIDHKVSAFLRRQSK
jgi:superkiller protein 3